MRIAVNTRVLLKGRMEGVCRYIHETTKRIVLSHPEHQFFFFFDRPFHPSFVYASNVTPVVLHPPARHPILWKIWFDFAIPRALRKHNIDVFLSGDTYHSLRTKVPTVLVSHDLAYLHFPEHLPTRVLRYYERHFPAFHQKAAHIVAVSEFTKKDIIQAYEIPSSKITVAYNASPEGFLPACESEKNIVRNQLTSGKPFFIYVGSIHPRKNIGNLIKAFKIFKNNGSDHRLLLLGRKAWNFDEYEQLINGDPSIIYLDGTQHDPRSIVPAADALIYVSLHEGFGIPILEGMSAGVPVISSNISSMPEVAGDAALLVNPHSVMDIASAMKTVTDHPTAEIIKKGLDHAKTFDWDRSAEVIYEALEAVS